MSRAKHFDSHKIRYDLIPMAAMRALAAVATYGLRKYDARNWEKGMAYSKVFGSLLRHVFKWWNGEKDDPESGLPHLYHAAFNLVMLIEYSENSNLKDEGLDDRPTVRIGPMEAPETLDVLFPDRPVAGWHSTEPAEWELTPEGRRALADLEEAVQTYPTINSTIPRGRRQG